MRSRRRATIQELRVAVNCLPRATRLAMLHGIRSNDIIVGAYSDANGICPMLAAHRAGGRTSFISFARAWDRFALRDGRIRRARRASDRELLILTTHLEASLLDDDGPAPNLSGAMADHRELLARRAARGEPLSAREKPGDPYRSRELRKRPGWAWMRVMRRYDEYERALARLESEHEALHARESHTELAVPLG
jgi:hypothetical protein